MWVRSGLAGLVLMLVACVGLAPVPGGPGPASPGAATPIVRTPLPALEPGRPAAPGCTLIGCESRLAFVFAGAPLKSYRIEVGNPGEGKLAIDCLATRAGEPGTTESYSLDDPRASRLASLSPVLAACGAAGGRVQVTRSLTGTVESIAVHCFQAESPMSLTNAVCSSTGVQVAFDGPGYLFGQSTITVHANGQTKTEVIEIPYQLQYPNGRACSPGCMTGRVTVDLP